MNLNISLIGNGLDVRPYSNPNELKNYTNPSSSIDSSDLVVRLNRCRFYFDGWTGFRSNILISRSAQGIHGRRMCSPYDFTIPSDVIEQIHKLVIFGITPEDTADSGLEPYVKRYPSLIHKERVFIPFNDYYSEVKDTVSIPPSKIPTLGCIALMYLLNREP